MCVHVFHLADTNVLLHFPFKPVHLNHQVRSAEYVIILNPNTTYRRRSAHHCRSDIRPHIHSGKSQGGCCRWNKSRRSEGRHCTHRRLTTRGVSYRVLITAALKPILSLGLWIIRCQEIRGEILIVFLNYKCFKIASVWNTSFSFQLNVPRALSAWSLCCTQLRRRITLDMLT